MATRPKETSAYKLRNTTYFMTQEEVDEYIQDIKLRVMQGKLPPGDMIIVENYERYKQCNRENPQIDLKKLMHEYLMQGRER